MIFIDHTDAVKGNISNIPVGVAIAQVDAVIFLVVVQRQSIKHFIHMWCSVSGNIIRIGENVVPETSGNSTRFHGVFLGVDIACQPPLKTIVLFTYFLRLNRSITPPVRHNKIPEGSGMGSTLTPKNVICPIYQPA